MACSKAVFDIVHMFDPDADQVQQKMAIQIASSAPARAPRWSGNATEAL